jgi:1,4-dihydroxy-2-naphthoyl-CoA hydrolase
VAGPSPEEYVVPLERTLDGRLGFEVLEAGPAHARARVEVTDAVRQRWGIVHGGAHAALAELLASEATNSAVWGDGRMALGLSNHTSFLRPVTSGTVHAVARRRHGGRSTWVWDVELSDGEGRLCAISRVTLAIRHRRSPARA